MLTGAGAHTIVPCTLAHSSDFPHIEILHSQCMYFFLLLALFITFSVMDLIDHYAAVGAFCHQRTSCKWRMYCSDKVSIGPSKFCIINLFPHINFESRMTETFKRGFLNDQFSGGSCHVNALDLQLSNYAWLSDLFGHMKGLVIDKENRIIL